MMNKNKIENFTLTDGTKISRQSYLGCTTTIRTWTNPVGSTIRAAEIEFADGTRKEVCCENYNPNVLTRWMSTTAVFAFTRRYYIKEWNEKKVAAEEARIAELEAEGMTTSDAQGILMLEQMRKPSEQPVAVRIHEQQVAKQQEMFLLDLPLFNLEASV